MIYGGLCAMGWLLLCSDEAWNLSPINADNVTALHQKYPQARVVIAAAEFDSPAFKQQAGAYLEVSPTINSLWEKIPTIGNNEKKTGIELSYCCIVFITAFSHIVLLFGHRRFDFVLFSDDSYFMVPAMSASEIFAGDADLGTIDWAYSSNIFSDTMDNHPTV